MAQDRYKVVKRSSFEGLVYDWIVADARRVVNEPGYVVEVCKTRDEARCLADFYNTFRSDAE